MFILIIILLFFLYARFIGIKGLRIKEYKIIDENITESYHGLKIVQLSDIHYGTSINKKELTSIVTTINSLNPDIIVFTGDLFDKNADEKMALELIDILSKLNAPIGKYAVTGNHDYDFIELWEKVIDESGFVNLNDAYQLIYKNSTIPISISGISTNLYGTLNISDKIKPINEAINDENNKSIYNILILHEPDFIDNIDYSNFNLILAGHSHNGQVRVPFIGALYTPYGSKKYYKEYYKLNNTRLYISSGVGTTILKIRLFNAPSISFYRITNK